MNSKWRMCHPEHNAVRRGVEGSRPADVCRTSHERSVVAAITCLFALLLSACTDYQAEFEESFGALEYVGEEYVSSDAGHHGGVSSSDESLPASSDEKTSKSSGSVEPSSATSSATPTSGGTEQPSSGAASSQSSGGQSSNSTGPSGFTESSNSTESSSSVKKLLSCNESDGNCFEDERDGQTYKTTAEISGLVWMAENLNYEAQSSLCYDKSAENCAKYGRLYEIKSYYDSKNLCPDGWRMPDTTEWHSLFESVGGKNVAGLHLKSKTGWQEENGGINGIDDYKFSALPGGLAYSQNNFKWMPKNAYFMTSSKVPDGDNKYVVNLLYNDKNAIFASYGEHVFVSVRCVQGTLSSSSSVASSSSVKSSSSSAPPSSSSFGSSGSFQFSHDGDSYNVNYVTYNGIVWMNENLVFNHKATGSGHAYNDGTKLDDPIEYFSWSEAKSACPEGWRLPKSNEFNESKGLEDFSTFRDSASTLKSQFLYNYWDEKGTGGMYWTETSKGDTVDVIMFKHKESGYKVTEGKIVRVVVDENMDNLLFSVRCVKYGRSVAETKKRPSTTPVTFSLENVLGVDHIVVQIGEQKWLGENLKDGLNNTARICRDGSLAPCDRSKSGYYYTYQEAMQISNQSTNWKLPNSDDINKLWVAVENNHRNLMSFNRGTNEFGLDIVRSGYFDKNKSFENYFEAWIWRFDLEVEASGEEPYLSFPGDADDIKMDKLAKGYRLPVRLIWTDPNNH